MRNFCLLLVSVPLSQEFRKFRWRMFGHALRLKADTPAQKAMNFFFEHNNLKKFRGRPRTMLVTNLNGDIKLAEECSQQCKNIVSSLESIEDLRKLRGVAGEKEEWKRFSRNICSIAEVDRSTPNRTTSQDETA